MRGRFANALRVYGITGIGGMLIAALIFSRFTWGWIAITAIAIAGIVIFWITADDTARNSVTDLDNLISAINSFNSGIHSVRARGASTKEVRALVEGFNKMAAEAEHAIDSLNAEEHRQMQFVSDVAHELRTPLTAIRGAAETLMEGGVPQQDQARFLSTIAFESERLSRLANDLLTLQRIEGGAGEVPLRRFNPREACDRAMRMLAPLLDARCVDFHIEGSSPDILGDVDRIQQVVSNLVDNASRMVGEDGRVWVELASASRHELSPHMAAKSFVDVDRFATLAICDNGPGIPEENIPRLFDRFFRTDASRARNRGGAGLGLSIVKAIVDIHGGAIEVQNRVGGGCQFTIFLPIPPEIDTGITRAQRKADKRARQNEEEAWAAETPAHAGDMRSGASGRTGRENSKTQRRAGTTHRRR